MLVEWTIFFWTVFPGVSKCHNSHSKCEQSWRVNQTREGHQTQAAPESWHRLKACSLSKPRFQTKIIQSRVCSSIWALLVLIGSWWAKNRLQAGLCQRLLVHVPMSAGRWEQTSSRMERRLAKMCSLGMSSCGREMSCHFKPRSGSF